MPAFGSCVPRAARRDGQGFGARPANGGLEAPAIQKDDHGRPPASRPLTHVACCRVIAILLRSWGDEAPSATKLRLADLRHLLASHEVVSRAPCPAPRMRSFRTRLPSRRCTRRAGMSSSSRRLHSRSRGSSCSWPSRASRCTRTDDSRRQRTRVGDQRSLLRAACSAATTESPPRPRRAATMRARPTLGRCSCRSCPPRRASRARRTTTRASPPRGSPYRCPR